MPEVYYQGDLALTTDEASNHLTDGAIIRTVSTLIEYLYIKMQQELNPNLRRSSTTTDSDRCNGPVIKSPKKDVVHSTQYPRISIEDKRKTKMQDHHQGKTDKVT